MTPPSTPPGQEEEEDNFLSIADTTDSLVNELSSENFMDMMYERYRAANTYGLLTKREVKMAGYWPSSFFA